MPGIGKLVHRLTPEWGAFNTQWLFPKVWGDERLSKAERSLITIAILSVTRAGVLDEHIRRARGHGVTVGELKAMVVHIAFYAGYGAAEYLLTTLEGVLTQDGDAEYNEPCQGSCCREPDGHANQQ